MVPISTLDRLFWGLWLGRHSSTGTTGCEALRITPGLEEDPHEGHQSTTMRGPRTQGSPFGLGIWAGLPVSFHFQVVLWWWWMDGTDNGSL